MIHWRRYKGGNTYPWLGCQDSVGEYIHVQSRRRKDIFKDGNNLEGEDVLATVVTDLENRGHPAFWAITLRVLHLECCHERSLHPVRRDKLKKKETTLPWRDSAKVDQTCDRYPERYFRDSWEDRRLSWQRFWQTLRQFFSTDFNEIPLLCSQYVSQYLLVSLCGSRLHKGFEGARDTSNLLEEFKFHFVKGSIFVRERRDNLFQKTVKYRFQRVGLFER